ncbi:MAG: leucine-rich repeat protein [Saccharofermentanales bacterium]|jgi:uncharacterized protein YgiM (DUF1202 family)
MKKKLYLRIRVLVLVLLLILSSLIIAPEQALADTEIAADEEVQEIAADEEVPEVAADEEVTTTVSDTEDQNVLEQSNNEEESNDFIPQPDNVTDLETGSFLTNDLDRISADETDMISSDESSEPVDESVTETDIDSTESSLVPTPEQVDEADIPSAIDEVIETPEVEQAVQEAVAEKQDEQDADVAVPDPADNGRGTRAAYTPEQYFIFDVTTKTITDYTGSDKAVSIPPSIGGVKVEHIGGNAFRYKELTSITIPNGIESIGHAAFLDNQLKNVTIPDSVTQIDESAFMRNQLTSVTISNSVIYIGDLAFLDNQLKNVTIPDGVMHIGESAFMRNQLTSVTISNSVNHIGVSAFKENQLINVTIPDSVGSIGEWAFEKNPIIWASIPESILFILDYDGNPLVYQPTAEQIGEYCFDDGVALYVKRYIKANYNIRETPNGKVITKLWRPLYVTGTKQGGWYKFTYNSKPAYVVMEATTTDPPPMTGYAKGNLNMRDVPGGSIIGTIPIGHKVQGKLVGNTVETTYNGKFGYVYASLLQKDPVQVTRYIKAGSNIRSTPGGTIIETLKMPILVTGTITGNYLRFTYKGQTAYVAMNLTTTQNPPITGYAKSTVNVRNAPGGSIIGTLPIGRQVKGVLVGNMVRFTYSSQTGYVYASLLQATPVRVTRYVVANSIIRSAPGGSIIARPWRPLLVSGTIQGAWLKFTYNGRTAYVAMSSTTTQNPPITGYTKSTVNVRSTPNGSIIGSLPANRKVSGVLVGNWVKFTYADRTGYISASLLKK